MGNISNTSLLSGETLHSLSIKGVEHSLIDGFIRRIRKQWGDDDYIIPSVLHDLCYDYWYSYKRIFCISPKNQVYITRIRHNNINPKDIIKSDNINPVLITGSGRLGRGMCFAEKISLPIHLIMDNKFEYHQRNKLYDVIFEAGGTDKALNLKTTNECNALILDRNENSQYIQLPSLPQSIAANGLIYSYSDRQLISVGGHNGNWHQTNCSQFIYGLSFNSNHNKTLHFMQSKQWKWKTLCKMTTTKNFASICMVNSNLLVAGGGPEGNVKKTVELYDFKHNELTMLKDMKYGRCAAGVYYDQNLQDIYIGGGHNNKKAMNNMEYYNFIKDEWYNLPNTNQYHTNYPLIWKYMGLLFIASCRCNTLEYIDLRCAKKWKSRYHKYGIRLRKIFNINDEFWSSRLL